MTALYILCGFTVLCLTGMGYSAHRDLKQRFEEIDNLIKKYHE
jgi:hypothetical protein